METTSKNILIIDLKHNESQVKSYKDLNPYIGGVGIGLKLLNMYREMNPIIFSVGPLNGFFPFASKTSIVLTDDGVAEDLYVGGNLSSIIQFSGIDAILLCGQANEETIVDILNSQVTFRSEAEDINTLGLPGKRAFIRNDGPKISINDYFTSPENFLEKSMRKKNVKGLVITGTETYQFKDFDRYQNLYYNILAKKDTLSVDEGIYPSCSGCPAGCGKSKFGELGGNVLIHSLVACQYSDKIYSDIGTVFSCLNVLGYDYTHEDIENLPKLIEEELRKVQ